MARSERFRGAARLLAALALVLAVVGAAVAGHDRGDDRPVSAGPRRAEVGRPQPPCAPLTDLAPSYLPPGWSDELHRGDGTGSGNDAVGRWLGGPGRSVTVWPSPGPWIPAASTTEPITVLDRPARLGEVHEGYAVTTDCGFELVGDGITRHDLGLVAQGLVVRTATFALWPRTDAGSSIDDARRLAAGADPWRADPIATAERFTTDVLGWSDPHGVAPDDRGIVVVRAGDRTARVGVARRPGTWWSVTYVWTFGDDDHAGSAVLQADRASAGTDYHGPFASSETTFWRGAHQASVTTDEAGGALTFDAPWPEDVPGAFLVLLRDAGGDVVQAWGTTVPTGPFAAG